MIIQFRNSLYNNKALDLNQDATIGYLNQIILRPFTFYCQKLPFLTDDEYSVFVADLCGNNLQEITEHCYFSFDFIEFASVYDFEADAVIIKIVNNINPNNIWFSNPLLITANFLTTEIDYKDISDSYMQSAGIKAYFTRALQESEVKTYVQESGTKVSGKATFTEMRKYIFEKLDNFVYRHLNLALARSIVYLDSLRITDKPLMKDGDISGSQNTFSSEFVGAVNYNDTYTRTLQIAQPLQLVSNYPNSTYTLNTINDLIQLVFNRDIDTDNEDLKISLYKDDVFISYLDLIQINFTTFEQVYNFVSNGSYKIIIPANKYSKNLYGSLPYTELPFTILDGEYDNTEYDNTEYLTN